jgi:peptidylprolyl isomerase
MKLPSPSRHRRWVLAGIIALALSCGTRHPIFLTNLHAQAAPAAGDVDTATGKPIVTTPSGLKYVDITLGTGAAVKTGDHITVTYVGTLLDGTKFDASADHPPGTFDYVQGVTSLIPGWTEGTSTMKVGGERKLIIPPQLGYGQQGAGDAVPPNATLIFDIKVLSSDPAPAGQ